MLRQRPEDCFADGERWLAAGSVTATAKEGGDDVRVAAHLVQPTNFDKANALAADAAKIVAALTGQSAAVAAPIAPAA